MSKKIMAILGSIVVLVVLLLWGVHAYQASWFHAHVTINQIKVGGLTAKQAIGKLESSISQNVVFVGANQVYDGADTKMDFTDNDLAAVKECLRKQRTWFPSGRASNCDLVPSQSDPARAQTIQKELEGQLAVLNKSLAAPQDAAVRWERGSIVVIPSVNGQQYDIQALMEEYRKKAYQSEIHLDPQYIQPVQADDPLINQEKSMLEDLAQRTTAYHVQDRVYTFKGSDIVKMASVSKEKKLQMELDTDLIKKKLTEMNRDQSTLHKDYTFTTHSGSVISVKGESYGWALQVDDESKRIQEAFEQGTASILAYNVYGVGWNVNGIGYHTTSNHGIGDTYVEVSIEEQTIWVYKDGKLKVTTPVVTGNKLYEEDTPKGVWYIEYKKAPAVLRGSEVGNPNYSVNVNYWAPFTLSGCGFHDASWRDNWASDAYLKEGSGGCVNTPPKVMESVYDNLIQYEPVIVY